jgi:hypothetical protein
MEKNEPTALAVQLKLVCSFLIQVGGLYVKFRIIVNNSAILILGIWPQRAKGLRFVAVFLSALL